MSSEQLRIAFFTNTFVPDINGVAHCIRILRDELHRRGHMVYVFAPAPADEAPVEDDPLVIRFPSLPIFSMDYSLAVPLSPPATRALRGVSFDIVHTHHPLWVGVWGAWYARRKRLPLVTTIHTHYELFASLVPLPRPLVMAYLRGRVRRYCNKCHAVTTPAESNRRRLVRLGVTVPVFVVPNPIELEPFEKADGRLVRQRYGLEGKFVVGYLGRLSPEKRVDTLLQAFASASRQLDNAHFLIVGDGPSRRQVEELVRTLKLKGRVTLAGAVPHAEVPDYHAAFDVLVAASLGETQPLAYAEAMAAGTPVVAVAAMGAVDMIQDGVNGYLVSRACAVEQMADTLLRIARSPGLRHSLSQGARKWAGRYSPHAAAERLFEAYEEAMRRAPS
ncbi:MAG: glycosyltransferase [Armatimonadetes bacterium]|nr:glycosyltransferase [Armatimonadota bacterium]